MLRCHRQEMMSLVVQDTRSHSKDKRPLEMAEPKSRDNADSGVEPITEPSCHGEDLHPGMA